MSTDEQPQPREPRAADGLDWSRAAGAAREPSPAATVPATSATRVPEGHPQAGVGRPDLRRTGGREVGIAAVGAVALAAAIVGGLAGGAAVLWFHGDENGGQATAAPVSSQSVTVQYTDTVASVAVKARPGVIKLQSTRRVSGGIEQDVGSGVILDADGHVLTNAHVVLGTETLKAVMPDGSERPAILVGHDFPFTDIAVVQIGPTNLTPIPMGDSDRLELGQAVVAIGNPLSEFDGSVSVGVVSGLRRRRVFDGVVQEDIIQTDAAVNNGNSGGALLNLQGQLVGIPTAVLRQNRGSQTVEGIAFALPSNRALQVARGIIAANGAYPRPTLGADTQDIPAAGAALPARVVAERGALVRAVDPGGPAAAGGIAAGDVITRIGDQDISAERPLLNALSRFEPGQTVRVVLNRNGRIIEVEVRLGKRN